MDNFYHDNRPPCDHGCDDSNRSNCKDCMDCMDCMDCKNDIICSQSRVAECEAELFCDVTKRLRCEIKHARCLKELAQL